MNIFLDICENRDKAWNFVDFLVHTIDNFDLYKDLSIDDLENVFEEYNEYENDVYFRYDVIHRRKFKDDKADIVDFVKNLINPEPNEDEIMLCYKLIHE